jgi:hypothetical protein
MGDDTGHTKDGDALDDDGDIFWYLISFLCELFLHSCGEDGYEQRRKREEKIEEIGYAPQFVFNGERQKIGVGVFAADEKDVGHKETGDAIGDQGITQAENKAPFPGLILSAQFKNDTKDREY